MLCICEAEITATSEPMPALPPIACNGTSTGERAARTYGLGGGHEDEMRAPSVPGGRAATAGASRSMHKGSGWNCGDWGGPAPSCPTFVCRPPCRRRGAAERRPSARTSVTELAAWAPGALHAHQLLKGCLSERRSGAGIVGWFSPHASRICNRAAPSPGGCPKRRPRVERRHCHAALVGGAAALL